MRLETGKLSRGIWIGAGILPSIVAATLSVSAAQDGAAKTQTAKTGGVSNFPSLELAKLDRLVGHWEVVETQYNAAGMVLSTIKGKEENTWTLDKHVLRRAYSTKGELVYDAVGSITWNAAEKKYRGVWFDNVSASGPTLVSGNWGEGEGSLVWVLEMVAHDGTKSQYKVIERFDDEETRTGLTYLMRGTELIKRMEVKYKRAAPCPDKGFRVIDDMGKR